MPFELPGCPAAFDDILVTCVVGFTHVARRRKLIGKNAKKDVHGDEAVDKVLRIYTSEGLDGVGFGNVTVHEAEGLVGLSLADLWQRIGNATSSIGRADHALFDLAGKALGKPSWMIMGGEGPEWVPVYDTTLYFSDLLPEFELLGVGRLLDEMDEGLREGHRAFKVKVGRGARWMDAEDGLRRDIDVVRSLSDHAGKDVQLMADANDQYGVETAKRFLGEVGDRLTFAEEMFPENVCEGVALRAWIRARGLTTLLADGESEHDPAVHEELARAGALDIVQPDIRALGLALQLSLSNALSDVPAVSIAAHNWGSYFATYKMLQLGRSIPNFLIAELDRTYTDLVDDSEWQLKDGRIRVPDTPGCGIRLREEVFRNRYLPAAWIAGDASAPVRWPAAE
jgi:L-alanine-DL-glutamate epimerase-like enolase superfamily enzyme